MIKVAIAQMRSTEDPWQNLALIQSFCEEASRAGARLICFPENILYRGRRSRMPDEVVLSRAEDGSIDESTSSLAFELKNFQSQLNLAVSLGSVFEKSSDVSRPYNSHWILQREKPVVAYHKIHLFSFYQNDIVYKESDQMTAGETPTAFNLDGITTGLSICYDLRFAELYRTLVLDHQAKVLLVPAAFTQETGRAHWHTLLRARAIENLSYVVAAGQWGSHLNDKEQELWCYGHSIAYDPWGEPLVEAPEQGDDLLFFEIDPERVKKLRSRLPSLEDISLW